jgi:predicted metal-binding protein
MDTMLTPVEDRPAIVACSTCRFSADAREDGAGVRGGARLIEALRAVQASEPRYQAVAVQDMPCLFACADHCTVHIRAPGKVGYVLGRFAPDAEAARAILDYAVHHAESAEGRVPFRDWPQGVKGHFIVRVPPPGFVAE